MKIIIKVPATTANLGPGFDALGLALDLWNDAEFTSTEDNNILVSVQGEGHDRLSQTEDNAIAQAALMIYEKAGKPCSGLNINCINRIPLGSGLGSSSAAMLTGMLGANALLGNPFTSAEILKLAVDVEGHPDNIAPAMLGGLVASVLHEAGVISEKLPFRENHKPIHITVVLPDFYLPTQQARAVLPETISRKDAIYNISRAVLVTEALRTGNTDLLGITMRDTLHQPYRLPLIPGAIGALDAAKKAGAAAVAISGAGPSLIAFSASQNANIGDTMQKAFKLAGLDARIFNLGISDTGAEIRLA